MVTHIAFMVNQGASAAGEVILLEYCYSEASFREAGGCCNAPCASTCKVTDLSCLSY